MSNGFERQFLKGEQTIVKQKYKNFYENLAINLGCEWIGRAQDILPRVAASVQATNAHTVIRIHMVQMGCYFFLFFSNQFVFPDADLI